MAKENETHDSIRDFWISYTQSTPQSISSKIEPKYYAFFVNSIRPGSEIVNSLKVKKIETYGPYVGS